MGLFDGAADGSGSAADLAAMLDLPVVLVVDCARQSQSVAALVQGFAHFRQDVTIAGVIANKIGSSRHGAMIERALQGIDMPCFGTVPRSEALVLPSRHLGLVGAGETAILDTFLDGAADVIEAGLDFDKLTGLACTVPQSQMPSPPLPPPGQRIAVALDAAFAFAYPHLLDGWRRTGATVLPFSPLAGEAVPSGADAVFLPGGYPELHAAEIAANTAFLSSLRMAAENDVPIYGECGGYMVLGDALVDAGRRGAPDGRATAGRDQLRGAETASGVSPCAASRTECLFGALRVKGSPHTSSITRRFKAERRGKVCSRSKMRWARRFGTWGTRAAA